MKGRTGLNIGLWGGDSGNSKDRPPLEEKYVKPAIAAYPELI
jgi:hypothetical protein